MKQFIVIFSAVLAAIAIGYLGITKHQEAKKRDAAIQVAMVMLERDLSRLEKVAEDWQKMYAEHEITKAELRVNLRQCTDAILAIGRSEKIPQELRERARASAEKLDAVLGDL